MITIKDVALTILVVEDIEETRDGIEKLLQADGYRVEVARDEQSAIERAQHKHPDLILVCLGGQMSGVILAARHIRERAQLEEQVPVVVFCIAEHVEGDDCIKELHEGEEVAIGQNVYVTRPDNFNQLRNLLVRLLEEAPKAV